MEEAKAPNEKKALIPCPCGSGFPSWPLYCDANVYRGRVCADCNQERRRVEIEDEPGTTFTDPLYEQLDK